MQQHDTLSFRSRNAAFHHRLGALAALALCVGLGLVARPGQAEIIDRVVAQVNDEVITLSDVRRTVPIYFQVVGVDPARARTAEGRRELAREVLDHLIDTRLLVEEAEERNLTVSDREVTQFLDQRRQQLGMEPGEFRSALEGEGIDYDDFRGFIRKNLTRLRMIQLDVVARVTISDEQIEQELRERYPDGLVETYLTTSHIFLRVPPDATPDAEEAVATQMREIARELSEGETFEALAGEVNEDATKESAGRLGRFRLGELAPEFERMAMSLDPGEVSEPVRTRFGYHLIRLEALEREPTENAQRVRDEIHFDLQTREAGRQEELYLQRLRNDAYIRILVDDLTL